MSITLEELLQAGVHFGHQTQRWNPKMKPYILTKRNGIHVIDLKKSLAGLEAAEKAVRRAISRNRNVLFVGTKVSSRAVVQEAAQKSGQFFVSQRWLGGMLTNFETVKKSIKQLETIEKYEKDGTFAEMQKKEVLTLNRKREKLLNFFGGIRNMKNVPGLVVITDVRHEHIAVAEARKLHIPIVAICDTNVNPELVDTVIPANDDAVKSVKLIVDYLAQSIIEMKEGKNEGATEAVSAKEAKPVAEEAAKEETVKEESAETVEKA